MLRAFLLAFAIDCGTTPCFPGQPLDAWKLYRDLEPYSTLFSDYERKTTSYGTCTVDDAALREADGSLVAELGCGVRVVRAGIVDEHGAHVGMRGSELVTRLARHTWFETRCVANGPEQTRCAYLGGEGSPRGNEYVVAGGIGEQILLGDQALAFLRTRTIVEMHVRTTCH
jgi:hypothetical protein